MSEISSAYRPRNQQESQYYHCVEDNFETPEQVYDDRFASKYGFLRPYVRQVIYRFLDCGILDNPAEEGGTKVKCGECGHYALA